jgi:hypothetical protein
MTVRVGEIMPDVSQAEIGRRMYHVHREKLVEQAVQKMLENLGRDRRLFSEDDVHLLGHLLQCTWNTIDQKVWDASRLAKPAWM